MEPLVNTPPELLTDSELGEILTRVNAMKNWITDIEEYALAEILKGNKIAGWKAVEGRSNRKITDIDAAFDILKNNGIDEAVLYERKSITLTALEKIVPKSELSALIGSFIEKPKGKPTLAETSDKRAEYKNYDINEIFGGDIKYMKLADVVIINSIISKAEGWEKSQSAIRFGADYGVQKGFIRK